MIPQQLLHFELKSLNSKLKRKNRGISVFCLIVSDPIPADKGQSVSYQLAKSQINGGDTPDVVISPRSNKLIKRKSK